MRTNLLKSVGLVGLMLANANCFESYCDLTECVSDGGGNTGGAPVGAGGEGAAGGDGGGGGLPVGCLPTEGGAVGPECGVFVEAGSTGDGSQASPYGSLAEALDNVGDASAIYLCDGIMVSGSVELSPGVSLFGGLKCADWTYSAENPRPLITGTPDSPAVKIVGAGTSTLMSVDITAPDAVEDGASSIALLVSEATVDVVAVDLVAGKGQDGAEPPAQLETPTAANGGTDGAAAGTDPLTAAPGGTTTCGGTTLMGGSGGMGGLQPSGGGGNGTPGDDPDGGSAGIGQTGGTLNCAVGPGLGGGGVGAPGGAGGSGDGATSLGALSPLGFVPASGEPGDPGTNGTSGGGGGGSKANGANGAGGGGGGAGGCGGSGGARGEGGGSSIALVSIEATVVLTDVNLSVASGGNGGPGGLGQFGQALGAGGDPGSSEIGGIVAGCRGGDGGNGGSGGNGGGGRGGHAIGIAYQGTAPTGGTIDITNAGAGEGGDGGNNTTADPGGDGDPGVVTEVQPF